MLDPRPTLTLAHSPDPDDAFMWWPLTGMVSPSGEPLPGSRGRPALDTGGIAFRAVPADIETLNRRAAGAGDLDITAVSARAYADAAARYVVTSCGASFGDGYGPKVVAKRESKLRCDGCLRAQKPTIAVPGMRTTAYLVLLLMLGRDAARAAEGEGRIVEMPFDQIIGAVAAGEVEAGLIIHEGQLTYGDAGLRLIVDVGVWWKERTGLPLPLGLNAVRRDLDARFGAGTLRRVAGLLAESVRYAMAHRAESIDYAMTFAMANAGGGAISRERVEKFVDMYVNRWTVNMGDEGREAIGRLLAEGAAAGLCAEVGELTVV
jgi:1,4-dihydroxy-6-naphthoate synthase